MHYVNERSQIQKSIYCVIPFERTSGKGKSIDAEIGSVVARGWDLLQRDTGEFGGMMEMFYILTVVVVTCLYLFRTVH